LPEMTTQRTRPGDKTGVPQMAEFASLRWFVLAGRRIPGSAFTLFSA
jgi:hypothetical protein